MIILVYAYKTFTYEDKRVDEAIEVEHDNNAEIIEDEDVKPAVQFYNLNTHYIKYKVYENHEFISFETKSLYDKIILKNLWINEPFHSTFFKILQLLDSNKFMIKDPGSKVLVLNIRDENNKMIKSKSYQVFDLKEVLHYVLSHCLDDVLRFRKHDAQRIILAIFIFIFQQSIHCNSMKNSSVFIENILSDYDDQEPISDVFACIKLKDEQFRFAYKALENSLSFCLTYPFNDSSLNIEHIALTSNLPKKVLKHI